MTDKLAEMHDIMARGSCPAVGYEMTELPLPASEARDPQEDIPDFTAKQWAWLKSVTQQWEASYVPTRSLFPGTGL